MQYTDLTKKELQREYNRMARRYTGFVREPLQLDMAEEDPLLGKSESLRAARHFGTVLNKELSDSGAARPTDAQDAVAALSTAVPTAPPSCAARLASGSTRWITARSWPASSRWMLVRNSWPTQPACLPLAPA